jgi:hypothetical protein
MMRQSEARRLSGNSADGNLASATHRRSAAQCACLPSVLDP